MLESDPDAYTLTAALEIDVLDAEPDAYTLTAALDTDLPAGLVSQQDAPVSSRTCHNLAAFNIAPGVYTVLRTYIDSGGEGDPEEIVASYRSGKAVPLLVLPNSVIYLGRFFLQNVSVDGGLTGDREDMVMNYTDRFQQVDYQLFIRLYPQFSDRFVYRTRAF